jgi:hypothetical protein
MLTKAGKSWGGTAELTITVSTHGCRQLLIVRTCYGSNFPKLFTICAPENHPNRASLCCLQEIQYRRGDGPA